MTPKISQMLQAKRQKNFLTLPIAVTMIQQWIDGKKKCLIILKKEEEPIFSVDVLHNEDGFAKFYGGWTNQNTRPRLVGDIDGDGRADIVGFGYNTVFSDRLNSSSEWYEERDNSIYSQAFLENQI